MWLNRKNKYLNGVARKKRPSLKWVVAALITCLVLVGGAVGSVRWWYVSNLRPVSTKSQKIIIDVELGSSTQTIADLLKAKGVIRNSTVFQIYYRSRELTASLQAGRYELDPSLSTPEIMQMLINGEVSKDYFTVLPGQRLDQLQAGFTKAGFNSDEIARAFLPETYSGHPALAFKPSAASLEGYLYPETFQITSTTKPADIVRRSLDEFAKRMTSERLQGFQKQGLTPEQAIILASMVEKEVNKADDRRVVAQVFLKRFHENIALGSDVTYFYAAAITGEEASPSLDSPYNTRKYPGLPPGPISNVGEVSLDAVAFPASTNYLFFVTGDDGTTHFSHTQAEHEENTRKYCTKLCSGTGE